MRFYLGCGAALAGSADGSPAAENGPAARAPSAYTPKHLAEKIRQSKSALEGERKQVTVLCVSDLRHAERLARELAS